MELHEALEIFGFKDGEDIDKGIVIYIATRI